MQRNERQKTRGLWFDGSRRGCGLRGGSWSTARRKYDIIRNERERRAMPEKSSLVNKSCPRGLSLRRTRQAYTVKHIRKGQALLDQLDLGVTK